MAPAVGSNRVHLLLRQFLYGRRERIAGTIYGTILVMAVLAAGSDSRTITAWELDVLMVGTVVVLWTAHVYAHGIAESLASGKRLDRAGIVSLAHRESSIVLAAVIPAVALLLGVLDVCGDGTAVLIALGLGTLTLAVQGVRYARIAALGTSATILVVALNIAVGLVIVGMKAALEH